MTGCKRALVIANNSPKVQELKQLLEQSSFECLQAEDWIEAMRWSTADSPDLIVTEPISAVWKGDKVFELVERGAFGAIPPPMIVLTGEVLSVGSPEMFSTISRIAPLPPSFGKSDLAYALEMLFSESNLGGQQYDSVGQGLLLAIS